MYRFSSGGEVEILLVHPGGPFWSKKDDGAWTFPRGGVNEGEELLAAAVREFVEETGFIPTPPYLALGAIKQKSGKIIHAWAFSGTCDPAAVRSNTFELAWPPRSGRLQQFPEVDRAKFFSLATAQSKILVSERSLLDRLAEACRREDNDLTGG